MTAKTITDNVILSHDVLLGPDRLIWARSKRGRYSAKEGYQLLTNRHHANGNEQTMWNLVWKQCRVIPKVQTFLWRGCHDGLAAAQTMHRRIATISPLCQRCGAENEYLTHLLFFCQGSRAVWLASELNLRTDDIPLRFREALVHVAVKVGQEGLPLACNTMWSIWKARNATVIEGRAFNPLGVVKQARAMATVEIQTRPQRQIITYEVPSNFEVILTDASWDCKGRMGIAMEHYLENDRLLLSQYHAGQAVHPFQAETQAVKASIEYWQERGRTGRRVLVCTDSKALVEMLQKDDMDDLPAWQAMGDIRAIKHIIDQGGGMILVTHVQREALQGAHLLANEARRTGRSMRQYAGEGTGTVNAVHMELSKNHFRRLLSENQSH